MEILRHVYRHRFLRSEDLYALMGRSQDRLSRRLTTLFRAEYLDRPSAQIDRFRSGGMQPFVYGLGALGAKYLKEVAGMPVGSTDWRARNRSYTRENMEHTLAVSRFLVQLELACRASGAPEFVCFEDILRAAPEPTRRSSQPMAWPVNVQWHGGKSTVTLAPDAMFALRVIKPDGSKARANFFVEIDRGTMTVAPSQAARESDAFPFRATVLRKLLAYADSWRQKLHESRFGIKAPRVMFIGPSAPRTQSIQRAAFTFVVKPLGLPAGLFVFATQLNAQSPLNWGYADAAGDSVAMVGG